MAKGQSYIVVERRFGQVAKELKDRFNINNADLMDIIKDQTTDN